MIPPLPYDARTSRADGSIAADFHRWLQIIAQAISSTYVADQSANRSFVIKDGQFGIHAKRLRLAGSERVTIEGSARLVICG